MRIILIMFLCLSFGGCATCYKKGDMKPGRSNLSIVVLRSPSYSTRWLRNSNIMTPEVFQSEENLVASTPFWKRPAPKGKYTYQVISIPSGEYKLTSFRGDDREFGAGIESGEIKFKINENEVIYIGDIELNKCKQKIILDDNFTKAKAFVSKEFPELKDRLKKRIVTVHGKIKTSLHYSEVKACRALLDWEESDKNIHK